MGLCSGVASFEYAAPHWKDDNNDGEITPPPQGADRRYPIAYTRGATVTIDQFVPALTMDHRSDPPTKIYYKAIGPGGQEFTIGRTDENQPIAAPEPLENTIAYHANYPLSWKVSFDGQRVWYDIGSTSHEMYVTLDTPFGQRYETMYHTAVPPALGLSTSEDAIDAIWSLFMTRTVPNKSGQTMGYYRGVLCSNSFPVTTAAKLIEETNGQCNAWVEFFQGCLGIHAIGSFRYEAVLVQVGGQRCQGLHDAGFLINNHQFTAQSTGCLTYPYLYNHPCPGIMTFMGPALIAQWLTPGVMDIAGIAGQDNADPASVFANHFIVRVGNNKWYDPSYGTPSWTGTELTAASTWTAPAVSGFIGIAGEDTVQGVRVLFLRARQRAHDLVEIQFIER